MNAAGGQEADASEMEEKERQPGELEDGLGDMEDDDSEEDDEESEESHPTFGGPSAPTLESLHRVAMSDDPEHPVVRNSKRQHLVSAFYVLPTRNTEFIDGIIPLEAGNAEAMLQTYMASGEGSSGVLATLDMYSAVYECSKQLTELPRNPMRGQAIFIQFSLKAINTIVDISTYRQAIRNGLDKTQATTASNMSHILVESIPAINIEQVYVVNPTSEIVRELLALKGNDRDEANSIFGEYFPFWRDEFEGKWNSESKKIKFISSLKNKDLTEKAMNREGPRRRMPSMARTGF